MTSYRSISFESHKRDYRMIIGKKMVQIFSFTVSVAPSSSHNLPGSDPGSVIGLLYRCIATADCGSATGMV